MSKSFDVAEALIDKHGLGNVLIMIGDICSEKATHIQDNWDDRGLVEKWLKAEQIVKSAVYKLPKVPGIK